MPLPTTRRRLLTISAAVVLGHVESLALPVERYQLAFTPELAQQIFVDGGKLTAAEWNSLLADECKYVHSEGDATWWMPSGQMFYSPGANGAAVQQLAPARTHVFLPHRYRASFHTNQFNTETVVAYDGHQLLVIKTRDALDNAVRAQNDSRVLAARWMTDPNGNRSEVAFDLLGRVVATAVKGTVGQPLGKLLEDFAPNLSLAALPGFVVDPHDPAASLLGRATDTKGQRVRMVTERQNGTRQDERIYLRGFEIYREYHGTGRAVRMKRETLPVMNDKQRSALVETKTIENGSRSSRINPMQHYQRGNPLGSASLELDKDGGRISYEEFHPYGTILYQAMNSAAEVSLKRYRDTGKERDEETGLYSHGARYYAPWLGRRTTADPIRIADRLNLYAYVIDSPSIKKDIFGIKGEPNDYACLRGGDKERFSEEKVRIEEAQRKAANEHQEIVQAAEALLKARDEGLVSFSDDKFDPKTKQRQDGSIAKQLKAMVEAPTATDLPKYMNGQLARIVQRMVEKAYERHVQGAKGLDFSIISLARPADKETSPHKYGSAIDIGRYAGKLIDFQHGNDAVEGVAQFYEDVLGLEVGMAFGLPRNPKTDPAGAAAEYFDPRHPEKKKYYDLPGVTDEKNKMSRMQPVLKPEYVKDDFFFDRSAAINHSPTGEVVGDIKTLQSEIARKRLLDLQSKDQQNILKFLFPDAWDHLHVQVAR